MKQFIICAGTISDGFTFYGPYDSFDEADTASDVIARKEPYFLTWIAELNNEVTQ